MATLKIETLIKYHKIINSVIQRKPMPMYVFVFIFFLNSLAYPTKPWYLCCAQKASRERGCARCIWKKWVHFDLRSHVHIFFSFQLWNWQPGAGPTATSWFGIYRLYSHRTNHSPLLGDTFERLGLTWQRLLAWAPRQLTTPTICSALEPVRSGRGRKVTIMKIIGNKQPAARRKHKQTRTAAATYYHLEDTKTRWRIVAAI